MGGEHKCPLCSATFTRPQHVGRHLRSHTGDRPYECKECPLKFARSDLLSRHVNKAHRTPEEGGAKPTTSKKGRRKSVPNLTTTNAANHRRNSSANESVKPKTVNRNRSASMAEPPKPRQTEPPVQVPAPLEAPQPPPLQAQAMYPHHPLLANPDLRTSEQYPSGNWSSVPTFTGFGPHTTDAPLTTGMPLSGMDMHQQGTMGMPPPQIRIPMRLSESDQGVGPSGTPRQFNGAPIISYEYIKKRACDQCSHSKVRCDFAEPCQRCTNRNIFCSYTKTPKSRTMSTFPRGSNQVYPGSPFRSTTLPASGYQPVTYTSPTTDAHTLPLSAVSGANISPTSNNPILPGVTMAQAPSTMAWSPASGSDTMSTGPAPMQAQVSAGPQAYPPGRMPTGSTNAYTQSQQGSFSTGSPYNQLAPTPSLTSMTTSPSSSDEPAEPITRENSMAYPQSWTDAQGGKVNQSMNVRTSFDGTSPNMQDAYQQTNFIPDQTSWGVIPEGTIDPRSQFRNPFEGESSPPTAIPVSPTTANSTDFSKMQEQLNHRRRSSAGLWATAFNAMSIKDLSGDSDSIIHPDPYTASMVATEQQQKQLQQLQQHITSAATKIAQKQGVSPKAAAAIASAQTARYAQSMGETKDMWKTFMSEHMPDVQMAQQAPNYDNAGTVSGLQQSPPKRNVSPKKSDSPKLSTDAKSSARPAMGDRSLSKSSSMPDLQTPLIEHAEMGAKEKSRSNDASHDANAEATRRQWGNEIRKRQASFSFSSSNLPSANSVAAAVVAAASSNNSMSKLDPASLAAAATLNSGVNMNMGMGASSANSAGYGFRPMASVLQHSSALQQTLAPERTPSFGLDNLPTPIRAAFAFPGPGFATPTLHSNTNTNASPSKLSFPSTMSTGSGSARVGSIEGKTTSADARPGNKRLASQTLVGDAPKLGKVDATFSFWDDESLPGGGDDLAGLGNGHAAGGIVGA